MKDLGYMFKFLQGNFSGHLHIVNVRVGVYTRVAMLYIQSLHSGSCK